MSLKKPAICSCGYCYQTIPAFARFSDDEVFGGAYWECVNCKSTLFIPMVQIDFNELKNAS